ncbi:hypothetical protein OPV22_016573 [Ensete ventricosum]|uniref:Uncharacterized protein n=1 Tax=Ensete ventricosum TaxID=4639 RepID=A0AAV8QU64_ENSVE|nr:hypothetical protein OPV22_016573 [Ensete ventricosum]
MIGGCKRITQIDESCWQAHAGEQVSRITYPELEICKWLHAGLEVVLIKVNLPKFHPPHPRCLVEKGVYSFLRGLSLGAVAMLDSALWYSSQRS